ncbi:MAG: YceI like family protein [Bacteroidetes bacterium]|jgi:polyisoprenoid-binding protein YceI|nr:YceI like family protein [Bacteroidota bacterium]MDF2452940.1 YceI like family protein [Bacteroidota bacterium]
MKKIIITAVVCIISLYTYAQTYTLDKNHTRVGFIATNFYHLQVDGHFKEVVATLTSKKEDLSDAVIVMTAAVNSIDTDNDVRDKDLRSADWFDEAKYPTIMFKSTSFKKVSSTVYKLNGEITIHGITKPIFLDVAYGKFLNPTTKKYVVGFTISGSLNRQDFKVGAGAPNSVVGDGVQLLANVEFIVD